VEYKKKKTSSFKKILLGIFLILLVILVAPAIFSPKPQSLTPALTATPAVPPTVMPSVFPNVSKTLTSQNVVRKYYIHLPRSYHAGTKYPLLVAYHGGSGDGKEMYEMSGFDEFSDKHNFIVVYPDGVNGLWNDGPGSTPWDQQYISDIQFTQKLIEQMKTDYSINTDRVYGAGFSNGGFFVQRVACALSPQFRAIAVVAATEMQDHLNDCSLTKPVSFITFNGTSDQWISFNGQTEPNGQYFLPINDMVKLWVKRDKCSTELVKTRLQLQEGAEYDIDKVVYKGCQDSTVEQYIIQNGRHWWPGDRYMSDTFNRAIGIDASEIIGNFFLEH
jgi:polyhydroxybutyrate depolymerase